MDAPIATAVIMAAGMGTRLNERGKWLPKGFIKLGQRPIIEEAVALLVEAGIERIVIVTGHLAEFYERLKRAHGSLIETVHNPQYAESGSMYSLYCARDLIDEDFLLLESDLIFERRALSVCLEFPRDNVVLMSGRSDAGDEVYIDSDNGLLRTMSKDRAQLHGIAGELVGICKISLPLFQIMKQEAERTFQDTLRVSYDTDTLVAAARRYPIYCHLIEDLAWSEIDYEMHLQHALTKIYPKILARERATGYTSAARTSG
jgi:2-aminoethylphosphonate-pyruvate transaminase